MRERSERLFEALSEISEQKIDEASPRDRTSRSRWKKWGVLVAALVLVVGVGSQILPRLGGNAGGNGLDHHFVVALEMSPEKLKIGEFKYKSSEKQSKWSIKPKVQPKIAYVKDGRVMMEAITKELLNALPI